MINMYEVSETNEMIEHENLDVRTITLGISLLDCIDSDLDELNRKIYEKITNTAKDLVAVGADIEKEFGIPIVNKRISITPIALVGAAACPSPLWARRPAKRRRISWRSRRRWTARRRL